jgi:hypothetical protein
MKYINIKIEEKAHKKLKELAEKECRSLKKQVEVILLKTIENSNIEQKQDFKEFVNADQIKEEEILDF